MKNACEEVVENQEEMFTRKMMRNDRPHLKDACQELVTHTVH